jgi:hypothetical protein
MDSITPSSAILAAPPQSASQTLKEQPDPGYVESEWLVKRHE